MVGVRDRQANAAEVQQAHAGTAETEVILGRAAPRRDPIDERDRFIEVTEYQLADEGLAQAAPARTFELATLVASTTRPP